MDVKEFCKFCDYGPNGFNDCNRKEQKEYFRRKLCSWANIEGVGVNMVGENIVIDYSDENIPHSNVERLKAAIKKGVEAGENYCRHPEKSPIEVALGKSS
jgi:hypothetical protein